MSQLATTSRERLAYYALRAGLTALGLLLIFATLSSHLLTPGLLYDEAPGPPPLRERLPEILFLIMVGMLLCIPHRWTRPAVLFWTRFALAILLAGFLFWAAAGDVIEVARGDRHAELSRAVLFVGVAIAVPFSLWWSRRISDHRSRLRLAGPPGDVAAE